jgi:hypothetical protein
MEGGIYIYRAILMREGRQDVRGREGERGGGWRRREEMDNEREEDERERGWGFPVRYTRHPQSSP